MEWISVKDRLPENDNMVIIWGGIGFYMNANWYTLTGTSFPRKIEWEVTHWMPLPKPPKV